MTFHDATTALQNAAAAWEIAVDDVQTAICNLADVDESEIPEAARIALGFLRDGGFDAFVVEASALEPDLTPPQELVEIADDLAEVALDAE